jgi:pyridoxamine 5'-phosphate oxidase
MLDAEWRDERMCWDALPCHPMDLFGVWHAAAEKTEPWHAGAMLLATATSSGLPSARVVLMRGFDREGLRFFTNYESRKGSQLSANATFAAVFWWPTQVRQIRFEGTAERLPREASEQYFAGRPRGSQLGAWSSAQSHPIDGLAILQEQYAAAEKAFEGKAVDCPPHWGGYLLRPQYVEFWQGGKDRLHDRAAYKLDEGEWRLGRLAP